MKTALVITLIVCGTIVVALPPASDFLHNYTVMQILRETKGATSVTLPAQMGDRYRLGCWILGAAMVGSAIFVSKGERAPAAPYSSI